MISMRNRLLTFSETKIGSASVPANHSSAVVAASSAQSSSLTVLLQSTEYHRILYET